MNLRFDHRGYAWMERRFGIVADAIIGPDLQTLRTLPPEETAHPGAAALVRSRLPSDRESSRRLRAALPRPWRDVVDTALRGEPVAPALLAQLDAVLAAQDRAPAPTVQVFGRALGTADALHRLAVQLGYVGFGAASTKLDGRRAVRLRRAVATDFTAAFEAGRSGPQTFATLAFDAFVRLSADYDELHERAQALGMFLVATDLADATDRSVDTVSTLLRGRNRNEFRDFVAIARRSSRRDDYDDLRLFLEEVLSE